MLPLWVRELARGLAPQGHGTPQHRQQAGSGKAAASCRTPQPCTLRMIGDSPGSDRTLLDNLLSDAIARTYKRCAIRYSSPIPTSSDLREESRQLERRGAGSADLLFRSAACPWANWAQARRVAQTFASQKVCGFSDREPQSSKRPNSALPLLFDSPTTTRLNSDWLFFG